VHNNAVYTTQMARNDGLMTKKATHTVSILQLLQLYRYIRQQKLSVTS